MAIPYEYSAVRLDNLIEAFREAQGTDEYAEARTALWNEIINSHRWHQANGFKEGQDAIIRGMKQFVEEKNKGR